MLIDDVNDLAQPAAESGPDSDCSHETHNYE